MARSAGLLDVIDDAYLARGDWLPEAREFAELLQSAERERCAKLRDSLIELRDRLRDHPAYADLTEDEEMDIGGDTAELSYLVRVANYALDYSVDNALSNYGKIPSTDRQA
jgi:hypothetical protein